MACSRLVGPEKGNCAFYACFRVSAAGWFVYIYTRTRARVRASGSVGLSFLFRKQNKVGSDTLTSLENKTRAFHRCLENKTRSVMFRKLNKGRDEKTSQRLFLSCLKNGKRSRAPSLCIRTHARALAPFFSRFRFFYREKVFFLFFFLLYIFFLFVLYSKKSNFLFFLSFLIKSKYK